VCYAGLVSRSKLHRPVLLAHFVEKQNNAQWGSGFLKRLSQDLTSDFPEMKGFSEGNLRSIRRWVLFYLPELSNSVTACDRIVNQPDSLTGYPFLDSITHIP
jgi:hypothetical protein